MVCSTGTVSTKPVFENIAVRNSLLFFRQKRNIAPLYRQMSTCVKRNGGGRESCMGGAAN